MKSTHWSSWSGVYYGKAQNLVAGRAQITSTLFIYLFIYRRSHRRLASSWGFVRTNDLTQWATSPNSGWPELDGLVSFVLHWDGKTGWKKKHIFTTKAALIMPGPHRGPFCLLTWATINTSSIQYNSPCSIIKSLDGPLMVWDWFDKQTKRKTSEKTCWCRHFWSALIQLVGIAYSSLQLDVLPPPLDTGTVAWVLCATTDQQRCITEQKNKGLLKCTSSAEPNVHIPGTYSMATITQIVVLQCRGIILFSVLNRGIILAQMQHLKNNGVS